MCPGKGATLAQAQRRDLCHPCAGSGPRRQTSRPAEIRRSNPCVVPCLSALMAVSHSSLSLHSPRTATGSSRSRAFTAELERTEGFFDLKLTDPVTAEAFLVVPQPAGTKARTLPDQSAARRRQIRTISASIAGASRTRASSASSASRLPRTPALDEHRVPRRQQFRRGAARGRGSLREFRARGPRRGRGERRGLRRSPTPRS